MSLFIVNINRNSGGIFGALVSVLLLLIFGSRLLDWCCSLDPLEPAMQSTEAPRAGELNPLEPAMQSMEAPQTHVINPLVPAMQSIATVTVHSRTAAMVARRDEALRGPLSC